MSAEPKRVELTDAERAEMELDLQDYWHAADLTGEPLDKVLAAVSRIVAAREAAARREALLEVRRSVAVIRTPLNNLVGLSRAQAFHVGVGEVATLLDNTLLAEPERDKEGGND